MDVFFFLFYFSSYGLSVFPKLHGSRPFSPDGKRDDLCRELGPLGFPGPGFGVRRLSRVESKNLAVWWIDQRGMLPCCQKHQSKKDLVLVTPSHPAKDCFLLLVMLLGAIVACFMSSLVVTLSNLIGE